MKIYEMPRGRGKTTKAIEEAYASGFPILVASKDQARIVQNMANNYVLSKHGYQRGAVQVIAVDDIFDGMVFDGVVIDELDWVLTTLLRKAGLKHLRGNIIATRTPDDEEVDLRSEMLFSDSKTNIGHDLSSQADNLSKHKAILDKLHSIYEGKNKRYGNSASDTFKKFGPVAYAIRLNDKLSRFSQLIAHRELDDPQNDESITDTLLDMANYAIMAAMDLEAEKQKAMAE